MAEQEQAQAKADEQKEAELKKMAESMGMEVVGEIQVIRTNPTPKPTVKEELKVEEPKAEESKVEEIPEPEVKEDDKEGK